MAQKMSPRPPASGTAAVGKDLAGERVEPNSLSVSDKIKAEFLLHVRPDGTEFYLAWVPIGAAALRVQVVETAESFFEQTTTRNNETYSNAAITYSPVKPRGRGWKLFDASKDRWTIWRRRARKYEDSPWQR